MTESQKQWKKGRDILVALGWPEEAIRTIATIFMEAGVMALAEQAEEQHRRNEELIKRVVLQ